MPVIQTKGAMSSQGLGEFSQQGGAANYIEDVFSTWLYTGNGISTFVNNGMPLGDTAAWSAVKISGNVYNYPSSCAFDSSGNICVASMASEDNSTYYGVIAKYNSSGAIQWQRKLSEGTTANMSAVCTDSSDNVYGGGNATDATRRYGLIVKYNSSGTLQWQRKLYQAFSGIYGIYADGSGNVYVAGEADDGTRSYALVAKYNSSGTIQWQRKLYQGTGSYADDVVVDGSGNVYAVGGLYNGTTYDFFIVKYNGSGTIQWQRKLYDGDSYGYGIALDGSGNVYVTGSVGTSSSALFITAKYNSAGTLQWQRMFTGGYGYGAAIAVDSSNYVYVYGIYASPYFEGGSLPILIKYDSSGAIQWERAFSIGGAAYNISLNSSGDVAIVFPYYSSSFQGQLTVLKQDGSTTSGTVGAVSMVPGAITDSAGTATDAAGTATDAAGTATDAAGTATDAAASTTATYSTQPAVTGKGGLVWIKDRTNAYNHNLFDTAQGATKLLQSNNTSATITDANALTSFGVNGFILGSGNTSGSQVNTNTDNFVSWTFAQQPKFFDVVTGSANSFGAVSFSHSLGATPGCIILKSTSSTSDWYVYHRSLGTGYMVLNTTAAYNSTAVWTTVNSTTVTTTGLFGPGDTYVAYLFAHDAGGFGASGADNVISCGSFTTDGSGYGSVNLGYEPQWIIGKNITSTGSWNILDTMRGLNVTDLNSGSGQAYLYANTSGAETGSSGWSINATGFESSAFAASSTIIYIAIRRGPMATPTDATTVFNPIYTGGTDADRNVNAGAGVGYPVDLAMTANAALVISKFANVARLTGSPYLITSATSAETTDTTVYPSNPFDSMIGINVGSTSDITNGNPYSYAYLMFSRAPGFLDIVCYEGTGSSGTQAHNLGVAPELMFVKNRSDATGRAWAVYAGDATDYLVLNTNAATADDVAYWNDTAPTSIEFTVGTSNSTNESGDSFIAYLFASCPGVSKVGTYTGTGATLQINCGFSAGARLVIIKRTDSTGDWYVWNSAQGIVSGNDPYLLLNSTAAVVTTTDWVDAYSAGFELSNAGSNNVNINGASYIFLAIA